MAKNRADLLSKFDGTSALAFIQECLFCQTLEEFSQLLNSLKGIFPHDYAVAVFTRFDICSVDTSSIVNPSYPEDWCRLYQENRYDKIDPIVKEGFLASGLQYWSDTYRKYSNSAPFVSRAEDFGLREGYSYVTKAFDGKRATLFSFAGRSIKRSSRTETILSYVAPHLHEAFCRLSSYREEAGAFVESFFSDKEKEVLEWAKSKEGVSQNTKFVCMSRSAVMSEISNIFEKLESANRKQAIAATLDRDILGGTD